MRNRTCLFLALPALASALFAQDATPDLPAPTIFSAVADLSSYQITVTGKNLMGTAAPVVTFGGARLPLTSYSRTQIVADLPGTIGPGSYQLNVRASGSANITVVIQGQGLALPLTSSGANQFTVFNLSNTTPAGNVITATSGGPPANVFYEGTAILGYGGQDLGGHGAPGLMGIGGTATGCAPGSCISGAGIDAQGGGTAGDGILNGGTAIQAIPGSDGGVGIFALSGSQLGGSNTVAGYFDGDVTVTGNLSKSGGSFQIDHPLDPAHKYLYHSFVESPDMMNIYNGNITTDASGAATVTLPDWFEALNTDFRYQLTVIGQFAQAIVAARIANHRFVIKTDKPLVDVSWQVTGVRQDAWANAHRIPVEVEKTAVDQGHYLHPELYNHKGDPTIPELHHPLPNRK